MAATPERISLDTVGQENIHTELAAYARAGHAQIPTDISTDGMRPEHAELLHGALGFVRDSLTNLGHLNDHAAQACRDFGTTEDGNEAAVSGLEGDIPQPI